MTNASYGNTVPNNRWQDWANLALAIWFFFSPWILQFGYQAPTAAPAAGAVAVQEVSLAAWNAWVLGVVVFFVSITAIGRFALWQEWTALVLGGWIFIAPWVLGFSTGHYPAAAWDHWTVGALIFLISATTLAGPTRSGSTAAGASFRR
jgi:hypothetical protein